MYNRRPKISQRDQSALRRAIKARKAAENEVMTYADAAYLWNDFNKQFGAFDNAKTEIEDIFSAIEAWGYRNAPSGTYAGDVHEQLKQGTADLRAAYSSLWNVLNTVSQAIKDREALSNAQRSVTKRRRF